MTSQDLIIEASPVRPGVTSWLMRLSNADHKILRDKLWRILTEEDYVLSSGVHNGFFISTGGKRWRVLFEARLGTGPVVTIVKVTEVSP